MTSSVRLSVFAMLSAIWLGVVAAPVEAVEVTPKEIQSRRCLQCHGQSRLATLPPTDRIAMVAPGAGPSTQPAPASRPGLHVTAESLKASVHAGLSCVDCHADAV